MEELEQQGITAETGLHLLTVAREWLVSLGGLPNLYKLDANGRCSAKSSGIHVIPMPRAVRRLLFAGSGMWDYDVAACHPSIFVNLARHHGISHELTESYVANRAEWFAHFSAVSGLPAGTDFKPLLHSWFTGGMLSPSSKTAAGRSYGSAAMRRLAGDSRVVAFRKEVTVGMTKLLAAEMASDLVERFGKGLTFTNAVGASVELSGARSDRGRAWSHMLTGYEQFAIRHMCSRVVDLQAVIYDGFIAPEQETGPLEAHVEAEALRSLGFPLRLKLKAEPLRDIGSSNPC